MKKVIFAMTIATGLLTASFANAQTAVKPAAQQKATTKAAPDAKNTAKANKPVAAPSTTAPVKKVTTAKATK